MKKAISTYLFCVVVLVIWIGANTLTIRKNTVRSVENAHNIESLTTLQEQSAETNQLLLETLGRMEAAIDKQGKMMKKSFEQTQQVLEKMEATNE